MNSDATAVVDGAFATGPVRRHRLRQLLAFLVLASAAAGLGAWWWQAGQAALPTRAAGAAAAHPPIGTARPITSLPMVFGAPPPSAEAPVPAAPHATAPDQFGSLAERLAERLARQPDDAAGWAMLARTYAVMGRHEQAVPAFRRAAALQPPPDAVLLADFADALAMTQGRRLAGEPIALVKRALALAPDNLKALSLAGTEAFERQDYAAAQQLWDHLRRVAPPDSVFVRQIGSSIDEARALAGGQRPAAPPGPAPGALPSVPRSGSDRP